MKSFRNYLLAAGAAASLCAVAGAAQAEVTTAASIGAYTDYRLRGVSLSDKTPVMQGSLELGLPVSEDVSLYAGVWGSSLDKDAGFGALETDWYVGAKGKIGEIGWSAKYLRLVYYDEKGLDFDQFAGEVSFPVGPVSGAVGVVYDSYTPGDSTYLYATAGYAFPDTPFSVKGTLGYEDGTFYDDKVNWGLAATYTYDKFAFTLEYIDTDTTVPSATGKNLGDSTVVFSVSSAF
jgi:uncharacterized protein (TIGR02001 family)